MDMTDEQRERLLEYVLQHMSEEVAIVAGRAARDLAENVPEMVKEVLRPVFEWGHYWHLLMAATALGWNPENDYEVEELLEGFERLEQSEVIEPKRVNWRENGF